VPKYVYPAQNSVNASEAAFGPGSASTPIPNALANNIVEIRWRRSGVGTPDADASRQRRRSVSELFRLLSPDPGRRTRKKAQAAAAALPRQNFRTQLNKFRMIGISVRQYFAERLPYWDYQEGKPTKVTDNAAEGEVESRPAQYPPSLAVIVQITRGRSDQYEQRLQICSKLFQSGALLRYSR
jgi:hypothetical protein